MRLEKLANFQKAWEAEQEIKKEKETGPKGTVKESGLKATAKPKEEEVAAKRRLSDASGSQTSASKRHDTMSPRAPSSGSAGMEEERIQKADFGTRMLNMIF